MLTSKPSLNASVIEPLTEDLQKALEQTENPLLVCIYYNEADKFKHPISKVLK